jgi:hypothetical protein
MLIVPIPINQGRSLFFTSRSLGLTIDIPIKRITAVTKSRQNANPMAVRGLFLVIKLIKIPEVLQQTAAEITSKIPEIGEGYVLVAEISKF